MKNKTVKKIEEDVVLREIVEDVKDEQFRRWLNKYGIFVIIGVALILTITISFEGLKNWQLKKHQQVSDAYSVALSFQNNGRLDESLEIYNQLASKSFGIYADLSKLQIASIYMEQNKLDEAAKVLDLLIKQGNIAQIREIAALKLAAYKLDTDAPTEEIMAILEPLTMEQNSSAVAHELLAMLHVRDNNTTKALAEYEKIKYSSIASDSMKSRAQDMMNVLEK